MRSKNPALMEEIKVFAIRYHRANHTSPTIHEIAQAVGVARSTVYRYLVEMDELRMLSYDGHTIETPEIEKCASGYFSAPVVGSIHCGDPEQETEHVEEYVSLPESIFGKGAFYILRARGDSMVDAGIAEGDLVVIKKQDTANIGDIVVALDENGENTLKTFAGIDPQSQCAILRFENRKKHRGKEIRVSELVVQGVAKHVIKDLGRGGGDHNGRVR